MVKMKGLMGRCLNYETTLGHIHEKAKLTKDELVELKAWRVVQEKKLKMAEGARDKYYNLTEELRKVLQDKEKEIHLAKDIAVREYRDSDALLSELSISYGDGFDEAIYQVKALHPDLDVSTVNNHAPEQTFVQPVQSDNTDELFKENAPANDNPGDQTIVESQSVLKDDQAHHNEEKDGTPAV